MVAPYAVRTYVNVSLKFRAARVRERLPPQFGHMHNFNYLIKCVAHANTISLFHRAKRHSGQRLAC